MDKFVLVDVSAPGALEQLIGVGAAEAAKLPTEITKSDIATPGAHNNVWWAIECGPRPAFSAKNLIASAKKCVATFADAKNAIPQHIMDEYTESKFQCTTAMFARVDSSVRALMAGADHWHLYTFYIAVSSYWCGQDFDCTVKSPGRDANGVTMTVEWVASLKQEDMAKLEAWAATASTH